MKKALIIGISLLLAMFSQSSMGQALKATGFDSSEGWSLQGSSGWTIVDTAGDSWTSNSTNGTIYCQIVNSPMTPHGGDLYADFRTSGSGGAQLDSGFTVTNPRGIHGWVAKNQATTGNLRVYLGTDGVTFPTSFNTFDMNGLPSANTWYERDYWSTPGDGTYYFRIQKLSTTAGRINWLDDFEILPLPAVEDWAVY